MNNGNISIVLGRDSLYRFKVLDYDGNSYEIPEDFSKLCFVVKKETSDKLSKFVLFSDEETQMVLNDTYLEGELKFMNSIQTTYSVESGDYYYEMVMTLTTGEKIQVDFGTISFTDSLKSV